MSERRALLDRYETTGDEDAYLAARPLYERALHEEGENAGLLPDYGYLLYCHGRYSLRRRSPGTSERSSCSPTTTRSTTS